MKLIVIGLLLVINTLTYSNSHHINSEALDDLTIAHDTSFNGIISDEDMLMVNNELKKIEYPPAAMENEIMGTVKLRFSIDNKGNVINIEVVSKKLGFGLEEEAIRILKLTSGKWTPVEHATATKYVLPIKFTLV